MKDTEKANEIVNALNVINEAEAEIKRANREIGRALEEMKILEKAYEEFSPKSQSGRLTAAEIGSLKQKGGYATHIAGLTGNLIAINNAVGKINEANQSLGVFGLQPIKNK